MALENYIRELYQCFEDGVFDQMDVFDTDRWTLSLSNYPQGQAVQIAAWLI